MAEWASRQEDTSSKQQIGKLRATKGRGDVISYKQQLAYLSTRLLVH
jgi:hypothetical protein